MPGCVEARRQVINFLTELSVGYHTFGIDAADYLGNDGVWSVTFKIIATVESISQ